jgi:hypothetical protein
MPDGWAASAGGLSAMVGNVASVTRWLGIASPILLPLVFLIAWLIVWSRVHT